MSVIVGVIILKTVSKDFSYLRLKLADIESLSQTSEVGWKKISKEVFQAPSQMSLLCAAVGSGV